ncbi:MAG: DUF4105 domain-containing protein [Spirochaetes bacterium]|nr:DUF4105 domain-containing protein [Spirochaetota bacterium]MBN2771226.1 DUF4105 domain-containing protein [Spirochaetota bacterium]
MTLILRKYGFITVLLFLTHTPLYSNTEVNAYVDLLIEQADQLELHKDSYWLLLLHYKNGITGKRSLIDDNNFFLSSDGNIDPRAELHSTIKAIFSPIIENQIHPNAKFIARFNWLDQKLKFNRAFLSNDPIPDFESFYKTISPTNAILVFPSGYLESPASMYGHTLLVLEPKNGNRLVSMAINYAAITDETFGPLFAAKGLFGAYRGYYSFMPYYSKINEYNNTEMRDMWEYKLNLNREELRLLVMHMVEMDQIGSDYYFLDENCSYNLLFLIEAARPTTKLTDCFNMTIEPIETIRTVIRKNLVKKTIYRPSLNSKIRYRSNQLSTENEKYAISLAKKNIQESENKLEFESIFIEAMTYDLSAEYLQFLYQKGKISKDEYSKRFLAILKRRNSLNFSQDTLENMDTPEPPENSHKSAKVSLSGGLLNKESFVDLRFFPSNHELMDIDQGRIKNSELVFCNIHVRYFNELEKIQLQRFDLLSILSLPVSDKYYLKPVWKFKLGGEQYETPNSGDSLTFFTNASTGISTDFSFLGQFYTFADVNFNFSNKYKYNTLNNLGGSTGLITSYGYFWKSHIYGKYSTVVWGNKTDRVEYGIEQMISFSQNSSFVFRASKYEIFKRQYDEYSLQINIFF